MDRGLRDLSVGLKRCGLCVVQHCVSAVGGWSCFRSLLVGGDWGQRVRSCGREEAPGSSSCPARTRSLKVRVRTRPHRACQVWETGARGVLGADGPRYGATVSWEQKASGTGALAEPCCVLSGRLRTFTLPSSPGGFCPQHVLT